MEWVNANKMTEQFALILYYNLVSKDKKGKKNSILM